MTQIMLFFHFIGLAMGIGTSFGFMILGIKAAKLEKNEAMKFSINIMALSKMGYIGISLLVISGIFLMAPFWSELASFPLLIVKLILVVLLIAEITTIGVLMEKVKRSNGDFRSKWIPILGRVSLLTGLAIVAIAVVFFG
ncbi:MAG: hypothetical protein JW731_08685 [Bacteroidales bacterium]|nr:hypothetical protein [Bacteroidales bacterium]